MLDFEINGTEYRADKLTAMQQFHISRRIAPLLPPLIPIALMLFKSNPSGTAIDPDKLLANPAIVQPFTDALSGMPDEAVNYVFDECLSVVKRKAGDTWIKIWDRRAHAPLMDDVGGMEVLLPIVTRIISANLGPFIRGLLIKQAGAEAAPSN